MNWKKKASSSPGDFRCANANAGCEVASGDIVNEV